MTRGAVAALALLAAGPQEREESFPGALTVENGRLAASLDLSSAFPPELGRQLRDGLTHVFAVHVSLVSRDGRAPLAAWAREIEVLWDVWDERFAVTATDPEHPRGRALVYPDWPALQAFLASIRGADLGPASSLGDGQFVLVARVELNPVKELLERTRELIGAQRQRPDGGSPSVLGAMASFLLGSAGGDGQARFFRSRPFVVRGGTMR